MVVGVEGGEVGRGRLEGVRKGGGCWMGGGGGGRVDKEEGGRWRVRGRGLVV